MKRNGYQTGEHVRAKVDDRQRHFARGKIVGFFSKGAIVRTGAHETKVRWSNLRHWKAVPKSCT